MTTTRSGRAGRVRRAEQLFSAFLTEHPDGSAELESLCREHAELADELRAVERDHAVARRVLSAFGAPEERTDAGEREPYRLIRRVARGGMGEVFEVWDRRLRRVLALKRTTGEAGTEDAVDRRRLSRFLREARITGRLEHPGIVPVHNLGRDGAGRAYYTMPLVRGRDFGAIVEAVHTQGGEWTRAGALQVLVNVCQAVAYAHAQGVLHRDLKSANVLVGEFGETYVVDWGLARPFGEGEPPDERDQDDLPTAGTRDGDVVGTPAFMPPEQAAGAWSEVGPTADVYAVGAMLYHLLAGEEPYAELAGRGIDVVAAVLSVPPAPLDAQRLPPELVAITERAMARDIGERYPTMKALAADLTAYLEGRVVRAHAHGPWAELVKWVRRNRAVAVLAGVALVATIGGLSAVVLVQSRAAERAARDFEALERSVYFNDVALAQQARERTTSDLRTLLDRAPEKLRGWEWWLLERSADDSRSVLTGHTELVVGVAFFPDGERVVSASRDRTLRIWQVETGACVALLEGHEHMVEGVAVSADGSRVASCGIDRTVRLWDARTGTLERTLRGHDDTVRRVAFLADDGLISVGEDGRVLRWSPAGEPTTIAALHEAVTSLAVDRARQRVAIGTDSGEVRLFALQGRGGAKQVAIQRLADAGRLVDLRYDDAGVRLAVSGFGEVVCVLDAEDARVLETISVDATPYGSLFLGADELLTTENAGLRRLGIERGDRRGNRSGHGGLVGALDLSPDGALLASGSSDGTVRLWERGRSAVGRELVDAGEILSAVAFAAGGERVVGAGRDGVVRLWDTESGALAARFETKAWVDDLVVLPEGDRALVATLEGDVLLLDLQTGADHYAALDPRPRHAGRVWSVAHDGDPGDAHWASVATDRKLSLWTLAGELLWTRELDAQPYAVLFLAGGDRVVTADEEGELVFWRASDGERLATVATGENGRVLVRCSADGSLLAVVGGKGGLELWDARTHERRFRVEAHELWAQDVRFSTDGTRLFTAGYDGWFKVWDTESGRSALALLPGRSPLGALAIGPAGAVACTGADTNVHLFLPRLPVATALSARDSSPPR